MEVAVSGADMYENLSAARSGVACSEAFEVLLISDAHITGEYLSPPYEFLNTVPTGYETTVRPSMVLRVGFHWERILPAPLDRKTDAARYHGGGIEDEVAAIASLILGVRIHGEAITRQFRPGDVEEGRPIYHAKEPLLRLPSQGSSRLPNMDRQVVLSDLALIDTLTALSPSQSIALVKAARLYQQALWSAETMPADAWLMMVSAIETVATCWKNDRRDPIEQLRADLPELAARLEMAADKQLTSDIAKILRGMSRVKVKFVSFLLHFLPPPPGRRPPEGFQVAWDEASLEKAFGQIYGHRSRALHDGVGFPFPMSESPLKNDPSWEAGVERPSALSTSTRNSTWSHEDCPMLLHTFAYIVREAILGWWRSELPDRSLADNVLRP